MAPDTSILFQVMIYGALIAVFVLVAIPQRRRGLSQSRKIITSQPEQEKEKDKAFIQQGT